MTTTPDITRPEITIDMPSVTPGARINLPQGRALQLGPSAGDIALAVQQVAQQAVNQALEHANAHLQQAAQTAVNQALKIASDHWQAVLAEREQHLDDWWRGVLKDVLGQLARKLTEQLGVERRLGEVLAKRWTGRPSSRLRAAPVRGEVIQSFAADSGSHFCTLPFCTARATAARKVSVLSAAWL